MDIIAYKIDGNIVDTHTYKARGLSGGEPIYFDNSKDALDVIRHSCAHLMAEALARLYPNVQFFVGPAIEDGFYYDIRVSKADGSKLGEEDLKDIEKKMKELVDAKNDFIKIPSTKAEVSAKYAHDDLKQEVLKRIPDGAVSLYTQGEFTDICRGPHVPNTKYLRFFKLTRIAGAYLGGDEKREMLTRIYGTAFADKESLAEYLHILEEAKKRDHRKLGEAMKFFSFDETIGAGLPIWLTNG